MTQTVIQLVGRGGLPAGTRLNDIYEIESTIGVGGMGEIYKGRLIETGDPVAIKMIKPELAGNEAVLSLFRKEASALHYLHHDAIVRYFVFSIDRALNRHYLAMEYVGGLPLSDHLKRGPLSFDEATVLRKRIASGLQAAHDKGVIHRDMSPDNIILQEGEISNAKIIDFGIARTTKLGHATVIGDGFAGKYNYVSPEQLGLFGGDVTNRSDIYSFGLVLAEAIMGRSLDMSGSQADVIQKRQKVPDLSGVDARLRPLIEKMLQPRPEDRPASMTEVAAWAAKAPRSAGGSKAIAAAAGVALLLAVGGAGYLFYPRPTPDPVVGPGRVDSGPVASPGGAPALQGAADAPPTVVATVPPAIVVEPPPEPLAIAPMGADERAQRIARYVRYFSGGPCLLLSTTAATDRSASVEAFGLSEQLVQNFEADFRLVNGFAPQVATARISNPQCPALAFVQRLDADPDPTLRLDLRQPTVKVGQRAQIAVEGAGDRAVELLAIGDNGRVRSLTSQLRRERGALLFEGRIDDEDSPAPGGKLVMMIATAKPLQSLANLARPNAWELFPAVLEELQKSGQTAQAAPKLVRIER